MSMITDLKELPKGVVNNLPLHAQRIYLRAHNNALTQYKNPEKRKDSQDSLEQIAHKVAWSAVEKKYHKVNGHWVKKL